MEGMCSVHGPCVPRRSTQQSCLSHTLLKANTKGNLGATWRDLQSFNRNQESPKLSVLAINYLVLITQGVHFVKIP